MPPSPAKYSIIDTLQYDDGALMWGGQRVTSLAEQIGVTPFYAYDRMRMSDAVGKLRNAMPDDLQIHYAMKANPMPEVVQHMVGLVDGLDVASAGELTVALQTGIEPRDVSFAGPGKRNWELEAAISAGITINMESAGEMRRIAILAEHLGRQPDVAIRVNPDFELKSAGMKMGGRPSQFGIDASAVPAVLAELQELGLNFRGFHIFSGSQNLREEAIRESMTKTVELVLELAAQTTETTSFVNLGGGLGIPYFANEKPINVASVGESAEYAVRRLQATLGNIEVIMELGRYLVGEAGIYVCRVLDIKDSRGMKFAVCDGGLHHHLAATGNFGQVLRKNYPVVNVEHLSSESEEITVVGPLCTPLDLLADKVELSPLQEGSLIAILQSGAYGMTASPHKFLSQGGCAEILI